MTAEAGVGEPVSRRVPEDAVTRVRRALERVAKEYPLFPGEEAEAEGALKVLEERLGRLAARGVHGVELSVYVRTLLPGDGRLAS